MVCKLTLLASLVTAATALRQREGSVGRAEAQKSNGQVGYLFTYGCPKTSAPAMTNPARGDGCFPGYRNVNIKKELVTDDVDIVPSLLMATAYVHYTGAANYLDQKGGFNPLGCGTSAGIRVQIPDASLHEGKVYIERASKSNDQRLVAATVVGMKTSYKSDKDYLRDTAQAAGWRLVGTSREGEDVSHLFQNPSTLECQLTFEGSDSFSDWSTDAAVIRVSYCGLSQGIHTGFRNEVRRMTGSSEWQDNIRPILPSCASVWTVGHSLGGAQATLFAACINSGNSGDNDYDKISWKKGSATPLPEI